MEWAALRVMLQQGERGTWRDSTGHHVGQRLEGAGYVVWQEREMPGRCVS